MDRTHRAAAPQGCRYQDQRRYVVAAGLVKLHGPTQGVVRLERPLDWSADPATTSTIRATSRSCTRPS
jgi:hypothetical protein